MSARRPHVVVAGGGIAGVEALIALRELAGRRLTLELVTPEPDLVMKPLAVAAPFGPGDVRRYPLEPICADHDVRLHRGRLDWVDVAGRAIETSGGERVGYDQLVLATGARTRSALQNALTFDGRAGIDGFREILRELREGEVHSLAFVVPEGVTWSLPLYELALLTADALAGADVVLTFITPEGDPLELFGRPARNRVRRLLAERGVTLLGAARAHEVRGGFVLTSRGAVPAGRVVALPAIEGPRIPGVPADPHGFLVTDEHGAVRGAPGVHAAGDGTAHPVKQGGLATQQADALAAAIAAAAGAPCEAEPYRPQLRAQLFTGALPWFLRGDRDEAHPVATRAALWSPPGKLAARHLTPYLAARDSWGLGDHPTLRSRDAAPVDPEERLAIRDLALVLADDEAESGHPDAALRWLEVAEDAAGVLPAEYAGKRRRWSARPVPLR